MHSAPWTRPRLSLVRTLTLCLLLPGLAAGCGTDDTAAGPAGSDAAAAQDVTSAVDSGTSKDSGTTKDTGGTALDAGLSCTSDLECLADLKESACAKPRCVAGTCTVQLVAKGTPCKPTGLEPSACQVTLCDGQGTCAFTDASDGTPCGDGPCGDACIGGKCVVAGSQDDGNPCTTTVCTNGQVSHVPVQDPDKVCSDDAKCIDKGLCKGGACAGPKATCDDGVACTIDYCQPGKGCVHLGADGLCADDDPCTQAACDADKGCVGGPAAKGTACEDGSPCTKGDTCDGAGQCKPGANGCDCLGDYECKGGDACAPLACVGGKCEVDKDKVVVCPDGGSVCSKATCNPATGVCAPTPTADGQPCDDADACTLQSACKGGSCVGTTKADCDDGDPCTKDACTKGKCASTPIPGCGGGGCKSDASCADSNPCTTDVCTDAGCQHKAQPGCKQCKVDSHCDDGDKCTKDTCGDKLGGGAGSGVGKCSHTAIPGCGGGGGGCTKASQCADNNPCTQDQCGTTGVFKGKCFYTTTPCDDGKACTYDVCVPSKGGCTHTVVPNCGGGCTSSQQCQDNSPCITSYCSGGVCKSVAKTCKDNDACTYDACDATSGKCVYVPIAGCKLDKCTSKADCDDGKPCTYDQCSTFSGKCYNSTIPNCDPTQPKCKSAADCDDGKPCTNDYCSSFSGKCSHTTVPNCVIGKPCKSTDDCDDKNKCTSNPCTQGKCTTAPITCNDYNPCTNDFCQSYTGKCIHTNKPGCVAVKCKADSGCDDQNKCTDDACVFGFCQHVLKPNCS